MRGLGVAIAAGMVLCASVAWAQTTSLPLTDDAFINGAKPDVNSGTWANIVVHSYGPKYGLVRFDAAAIAGQGVSEATLTLYLNSLAVNGTISVHAITTGWNESTVTWNNQPSAETTATAIVELTTGDVGSVIAIDVTAAVQRWADGSLADAGFLIVTSEGIKAIFDAKEMAGGVPATLAVNTGEPVITGEAIVLDFTDPDDCVIDEPGYYILDRSWDFSPADPQGSCTQGIDIVADYVLLDLQGFEIRCEACAGLPVDGRGDNIVLRNGIIQGGGNEGLALNFDDGQIENLSIFGDAELFPWGRDDEVTIRTSSVSGDLGVNSAGDPHNIAKGGVSISNTAIGGSFIAWYVAESVDIRNCRLSGGLYFEGANGIIRNNDIAGGIDLDAGGTSVISWNTIGSLSGPAAPVGIRLKANTYGTVVEGNIIRNVEVGIEFDFTSTGNFYGNNRVSATTPFVGTDGQTDWGGNVSF